ncbi:aldehyde dehydrogenase family 8 member A1-like protein [Paraphysoderma sedebokerense]|nr:aldehyde dehydrogenase family 8 member A1-like protein [Paraphysoderma sedebokerense]KAI9144426.1 aldehyde dehydrogenase family 8 member A1-like protein [Paraphysoderma sedebokerense]
MADTPKAFNFINGEFLPPSNNKYLDSFNPSTGKVHYHIPDSSSIDVDQAVKAAVEAFDSWSGLPRSTRCNYLLKIADLLESRLDQFALAESKDQGKPVWLAKSVDIPRAVYNFRFFANAVTVKEGKVTELEGVALNYTRRDPVGVAGLISPWNLPLYLLTWKIAPAIALGNTCVCKPSEFTSVTAYMLCQVLIDAGLPRGVVNMVFGTGPSAGASLVTHPKVPLISFTGGTATGEKLITNSAPLFKKLSLELGGKNPAIIFSDADLKSCIPTTVRSSFANQGEICLCTSKIFVHKSIYDEFVEKFVEETKKWTVGNPLNEETKVGALISKEHLEKVMRYVDIAKQEGGTIAIGGRRVKLDDPDLAGGYYMEPTVVTGLPPTARCMQEEIFGPVTCIYPFETEEEAVKYANGVQYGLAATVWSNDTKLSHRISKALHTGYVWVNCWMVRDLNMPFGGYKASGLGREGWPYSLEFFTEEKTVCIAY